MNLLIIAISQFLFSLFRTLNTRYTAKDKITLSLITSTLVKTTWLISTFYGIKGLNEKDYLAGVVYVVCGIIGDRVAFMFKNR